MANTNSAQGEFDHNAAYAHSFGLMAHKTTYYDAMGLKSMNVDMRPELNKAMQVGMKAHLTTAGGVGTAGYALVPIYVDPQIIDQTRKYTPLVELVPRVTNQGMYADYNNITAKGGAFTANENSALAETDTTYDRFSTQIKFLYAVGAVSGPSNSAQPSYILQGFNPSGSQGSPFSNASAGNALQQEVLVKTRELKELEEALIINGNSSTNGVTGNTGPNGSEFDGIVTLMSTTNTVAKSGAALALGDLTKAVRYAFDDGGRPNLGICASSVYEDIEILLKEKFGYMQSEKQVFWGFNTIVLRTMVGDIPVIPSMFLSNTSSSKAIYFMDMSVVEMRVLQDMTYQELAMTNDSRKFMLKIYEALIIRNTSFCASVTGIL